ncbi:MAG: hypothetical protein P1U87_21325 [Verrucomicrobiales bacterium]|nr:hypothetical protein [Verrucomicrobiales bacterium]
MKSSAPFFLSLALVVIAVATSSCGSKERATAGIADEYGMLSVEPKKEKKEKKERFRLKSIAEMTDPMVPDW